MNNDPEHIYCIKYVPQIGLVCKLLTDKKNDVFSAIIDSLDPINACLYCVRCTSFRCPES